MALLQVDYFSAVTILSVCLEMYIQASINFAVLPEGNLCLRRAPLSTFRSISLSLSRVSRSAKRSQHSWKYRAHPIYVARSQKLFLAVGHWQERPPATGRKSPCISTWRKTALASGVRPDADIAPRDYSHRIFWYLTRPSTRARVWPAPCVFSPSSTARIEAWISWTGINNIYIPPHNAAFRRSTVIVPIWRRDVSRRRDVMQ